MKNIVIAGIGSCARADMEYLGKVAPMSLLRRFPAYALMGLQAAVMALRDAERWPCSQETGLVTGTAYGCEHTSFDYMDSIIKNGPALSSPIAFSHSVNNIGAALIGIALNLQGPAMTIQTQAQSFAGAMTCAVTMLRRGRCSELLLGVLNDYDTRMDRVFPGIPPDSGSFFMFLTNNEH